MKSVTLTIDEMERERDKWRTEALALRRLRARWRKAFKEVRARLDRVIAMAEALRRKA